MQARASRESVTCYGGHVHHRPMKYASMPQMPTVLKTLLCSSARRVELPTRVELNLKQLAAAAELAAGCWSPSKFWCTNEEAVMDACKCIRAYLLLCGVLMILQPSHAHAQQNSGTSSASRPTDRDGQHDFDWDIGTWKTHQRRLLHPLTGSTTWVEYNGTDVVRKIWDGANQGIIQADGPAGHLEIYTLRLYNPDAHQWDIYFLNSSSGALSLPVIGEFKN